VLIKKVLGSLCDTENNVVYPDLYNFEDPDPFLPSCRSGSGYIIVKVNKKVTKKSQRGKIESILQIFFGGLK
jgi:hypothetical protein